MAKVDAADGTGIWAIDGGGSKMEYPWAFDVDATGNTYVGGLTSSPSLSFGARTITNLMHKDSGGDGKNQFARTRLDAVQKIIKDQEVRAEKYAMKSMRQRSIKHKKYHYAA